MNLETASKQDIEALLDKYNLSGNDLANLAANPGEDLEQAMAAIAHTKRQAKACQDPCAVPEGSAVFEALRKPLEHAKQTWLGCVTSQDDLVFRVHERFCRLLPSFGIAPTAVDHKTEDFAWAKVVAVLSGAGHLHWPRLCAVMAQRYPWPYEGDETEAEWAKLVLEATRMSKWPAQLSCLEWHSLGCLDPMKKIDMEAEHYTVHRVVAVYHILKHVWCAPDGDYVHAYYRGVAQRMQTRDMGTTLFTATQMRGDVLRALHADGDARAKAVPPHKMAARWVTETLTPKSLLRQLHVSALPPSVLSGPWTGLVPNPSAMRGWIQHGLSLSGAWIAQGGKIRENVADDEDIVGVGWDLADPFHPDKLRAKREFQEVLPATYSPACPAEIFREAFPNMVTEGNDGVASVLFDLPIYADLMRRYMAVLRQEYPLILFLPAKPTMDDSTDQGKSVATLAYARAMSPGIAISRVPDSTSAPDTRMVAEKFRTHGTIAVDEWHPPKSEQSPLAHDNLQSLITGGEVTLGRVFENTPIGLRLEHSIVASAKCVDFPPDMVNRTFFFFLDNLSEEARGNAMQLARLRNGLVSMEMRLGAWADIEQGDFVKRLAERPLHSGALRFEGISTLAKVLCEERGVEFSEVEAAIRAMHIQALRHQQEADDTGLSRVMRGKDGLRLALSDILPADNDLMESIFSSIATMSGGWATATELLDVLCIAHGLDKRNGYCKLLPVMTGISESYSNRHLVHKVSEAIRARLGVNQYLMHPDKIIAMNGWGILRRKDKSGQVRVRVSNEPKDFEGYERAE